MKRSEVIWSDAATPGGQSSLSAKLTDKDGLEWDATITHELYRALVKRLAATLFCRTAARMYTNSTHQSITEAQEWCYETLGIE